MSYDFNKDQPNIYTLNIASYFSVVDMFAIDVVVNFTLNKNG
jgi:hypothetical protein